MHVCKYISFTVDYGVTLFYVGKGGKRLSVNSWNVFHMFKKCARVVAPDLDKIRLFQFLKPPNCSNAFQREYNIQKSRPILSNTESHAYSLLHLQSAYNKDRCSALSYSRRRFLWTRSVCGARIYINTSRSSCFKSEKHAALPLIWCV